MLKTNTKEDMKKIIKILIIFTLIITIMLCCNINQSNATIGSEIEEKQTNNDIANYILDVEDKEEVSDAIKDLILTINSEGMNKSLLSQTLNFYTQLTDQYTNNEIVDMIERNKGELEKNNVSMDNINSIETLLKNVDTAQLKKVLSQVDVDQISAKIENGESVTSILKSITGNMTTTEKVNFVMDILLSAYVIQIIAVALIVLFIYRTLLRCVIYKKAHQKAWAAFIPIYRNIVMLKICGMSPWWLLLLLVPVIGWLILFVIMVASKFMLAESFGKGTVFAFGLWLLAPIFETILVFSRKTKYIGFEEE